MWRFLLHFVNCPLPGIDWFRYIHHALPVLGRLLVYTLYGQNYSPSILHIYIRIKQGEEKLTCQSAKFEWVWFWRADYSALSLSVFRITVYAVP